jgi:putative ABC transport system permease protein
MLKNFLTISIRSLTKNGVYSFINIFGLAIGMACCILIMLWVHDEKSYDSFHQRQEELFQVLTNAPGNNGIQTNYAVPLPLSAYLRENEDGIRYVAATDWGLDHLLSYKEQRLIQAGRYVEADFLKMFTFEFIAGNPQTALKDPGGIVLTASTANALFGDEPAMGKVVRVDDKLDLSVTGVMKDVPSNSTFQFTYLMPFSTYLTAESWVNNVKEQWETNAFQLFVELHPSADKDVIESRIERVIPKHYEQSKTTLMLHPLAQWRLYSSFQNGKPAGGYIDFVRPLSVIAFFILLIACINFMNLATARSERRAREVGIRKTIGSGKHQLILQFLSESLLISLASFILALGIVELSLPFYNNVVNKSLFIPYANPQFWLISLGVVILTGMVAGSYPAFYLSSFNPATVLKGKARTGNKTVRPRQVLVTLQFIFTIFQIIGTIVFYRQIQHGQERDIGYDRKNLLLVSNSGELSKNYRAIKNELLSAGLATSVTKSNAPVTAIYAMMDVTWPGKTAEDNTAFVTVATEYDYLKTMNIKLSEGRDFSPQYNDSSAAIVNHKAVTTMGMTDPIGKKITWEKREYTIVGVMEDVIMGSPFKPVEPTMMIYMTDWISDYTIRLPEDKNLNETIAGLENIFKKYNPAYPFQYRFADDEFNKKFNTVQLIGRLVNLFSALAIVLSCLGLFGLAAFTAEQRTKEIGIRKVMGASIPQMVMLLSKDFALLVLIAFVVTAPGAWYLFNLWLDRFPYRIDVDWTILALAGLTALILAMVTVSSQALKAAVANPVNSLKNE